MTTWSGEHLHGHPGEHLHGHPGGHLCGHLCGHPGQAWSCFDHTAFRVLNQSAVSVWRENEKKGRLPIDWTENPLCQDSAHGVVQGVVHGVVQGVVHGVMQGVVQKCAFTCEFLRVVTGK